MELLYADGGTTYKVEDMESRDGEERSLSEHGEDKDHGLWPQSEPSEKIWKGSLWCLSDRCRKKCIACPRSTRSAMESKTHCALIVISDVIAAWERRVP